MSLSAPPAFATGQGGGATVEEFVCFLSTGDQIRLGTGKVVTTPSGNVHVVCKPTKRQQGGGGHERLGKAAGGDASAPRQQPDRAL
jgi:hypothetical protein